MSRRKTLAVKFGQSLRACRHVQLSPDGTCHDVFCSTSSSNGDRGNFVCDRRSQCFSRDAWHFQGLEQALVYGCRKRVSGEARRMTDVFAHHGLTRRVRSFLPRQRHATFRLAVVIRTLSARNDILRTSKLDSDCCRRCDSL